MNAPVKRPADVRERPANDTEPPLTDAEKRLARVVARLIVADILRTRAGSTPR